MTEVYGEVSQGYEAVAEAFSSNFEQFEEIGAAFCLYVEGKSVVDIWGGVADVNSGRSWDFLLYTSDAADEGLGVDLGGRRIM